MKMSVSALALTTTGHYGISLNRSVHACSFTYNYPPFTMKAVMLAFCLVLGTLVAGAPVVERRHIKPKFTSMLVFGDSFSDTVRFLSVNKSDSKVSHVPLPIALVIRETEHSCSRTVHGQRTPHILMAGSQMGRSIQNSFRTCWEGTHCWISHLPEVRRLIVHISA